jgi:transposase
MHANTWENFECSMVSTEHFWKVSLQTSLYLPRCKMKTKQVQDIVLSKLQSGQFPTQISRDLNGLVSTATIERWSRMYRDTGAIELSHPPGRTRSVRTKATVKRAKQLLKGKSKKSVRILARKLNVNRESVRRVIKHDLLCKPYKVYKQPKLTDDHKRRRVQFSNWVRNNLKKSQTNRIVFSDEKLFSVDGVWNNQNERIWAVSREVANESGGLR